MTVEKAAEAHLLEATFLPTPMARGSRWSISTYQRLCWALDASSVVVAGAVAWALRFVGPVDMGSSDPRYGGLIVGFAVVWGMVLAWRGAYDRRVLGTGTEEFKRVVSGTLLVFSVVASVSFLFKADISRGFVLVAIPVGLMLLVLGRATSRRWLHGQRLAGHHLQRTLVVGEHDDAHDLITAFRTNPLAGFAVVDMASPPPDRRRGADSHLDSLGIWVDGIKARVESGRVEAVALTSSATISNEAVRRLAWALEGPGVDLLVAPSLGDIAGPRLSFRPAAGLPLIHLDEPQLTRPKRFAKRALDAVGSAAAIVLLSPLLVLIALAVKVSSHGPVFYTQERVGQAGEIFRFVKFRTMVDGAHEMRDEIIGAPDEHIAQRYRHDPRVTPVGRLLRRLSLDELPQLFAVFSGRMSIVGPRPVLPEEMHLLGRDDHRRHLTKPGLTGIWQISGRKETSWDERMQMDLQYIETWSPALDLVIVVKTVKAVLSGHGAY